MIILLELFEKQMLRKFFPPAKRKNVNTCNNNDTECLINVLTNVRNA